MQFFAVTGADGEQLFALAEMLRPMGGSRFSRAEGHTELGFMPLASVLHAFPYLAQGTDVYLVASLDELDLNLSCGLDRPETLLPFLPSVVPILAGFLV